MTCRRRTLPTAPATSADRACVYLLQRLDRRRFKLGWARQPMLRVRKLPEFSRGELDLASSKAIWLPTRPRAEQVERSMHKTLAPYWREAGHNGEGSQEWFEGKMADRAMRLLSQMPLDESSTRTARLVPFTVPLPAPDAVSVETGPQDVWWAIEDLLSRLGMQLPISVFADPEPEAVVHGFRDAPLLCDLRRAAVDADTFQAWRDGRPLSFVRVLYYQGADLVLDFTPLKVVERWDDGPDLVWQIKGFLARLKRTAKIRRVA